jgi:DNA-binding transcriptional LysR family regulator
MELSQLKYYVTIADTLSFTKAAELLRVSQPALSYQMHKLELELGTKLFNRDRRKIALTPDGRIFLPLAQAVLFRADEAVRVLKEHLGEEAGEVRMGGNPSVAAYVLPSLFASFRRDFPRVSIHLLEGGDMELQEAVVEGTVDFAVVTAPGSPRTLDVIPLGAEDLLLALPSSHRLAGRSVVGLGEVAEEEFVFPTTSFNVTTQFIDACRRMGFEPRVLYQTGSFESVKGFIREGLGISTLPRIALYAGGNDGLALVRLEEAPMREHNLIRGKDRYTTGAARALMRHVATELSRTLAALAPRKTEI